MNNDKEIKAEEPLSESVKATPANPETKNGRNWFPLAGLFCFLVSIAVMGSANDYNSAAFNGGVVGVIALTFAIIGLIKGVRLRKGVILSVIVIGLGGVASLGVFHPIIAAKTRKTIAHATAIAIESSVKKFYAEYDYLPNLGTSDTTLSTSRDREMLQVLLGLESDLNARSINFLSVKEGKGNVNGLIYAKDGRSVIGLFDPWGGGYSVRLDLDYDGKIDADESGGALINRRVAVWSNGPDHKPRTEDDIKTW